jgi:DNA polymerase (family X)
MENRQIVDQLEEMATLMELMGQNAFRCRAYTNAARQIELLQEPVSDLVARGELDKVKGIGKGLAGSIAELVQSGTMTAYSELRASVPEGLLEMTEVPGLGAKRVRAIHESLGISDVDALAKACERGELEKLSGFGKKTSDRIRQGIAYLQQHRGSYLCSTAKLAADGLCRYLSSQPGAGTVMVAGSVRRAAETTRAVDIVATAEDPVAFAEAFMTYGEVAEVTARSDTKVSVVLASGLRVDLRIVPEEAFPFSLYHFTGSKEHNTQMRSRARARGLKMDEFGLYRGETTIPCADEAAIFSALDLQEIPPELREGAGEIELAERGEIPGLVEATDLQGTLHVHTTYSDGHAEVEAMARTALKAGYSYIGICDHSRAAAYANGVTEERLRRQWEEIDRANDLLDGIRVLKGIEVDILGDGQLDFEDDLLAELDVVVASIHSRFTMTRDEATRRVIRAVASPHVDILGHPTGRLLLSREGYPLDIAAVIEAAAEHHTAIELNAHPRRLDLDWRHLALARNRGVRISVNTDAHDPDGLSHMSYGVGIARKGGLTRNDVLNALPLPDLVDRLSMNDA